MNYSESNYGRLTSFNDAAYRGWLVSMGDHVRAFSLGVSVVPDELCNVTSETPLREFEEKLAAYTARVAEIERECVGRIEDSGTFGHPYLAVCAILQLVRNRAIQNFHLRRRRAEDAVESGFLSMDFVLLHPKTPTEERAYFFCTRRANAVCPMCGVCIVAMCASGCDDMQYVDLYHRWSEDDMQAITVDYQWTCLGPPRTGPMLSPTKPHGRPRKRVD